MAHLLGSKSCLDSLRQDVLDLHSTISETVSCGGAIRVSSWKYPDKLAADINIPELLQDYIFMPNEAEDNQVAHIIMYELVIDRLVYLLHLATNYVSCTLEANTLSDSMSQCGATSRVSSASRLPSMSTGLVVKKLWLRISALKKQFEESRDANQKLNANVEVLEDALEKVTLDYLEATRTDSQENLIKPANHSILMINTVQNSGCLPTSCDEQMIPQKLSINGSPEAFHENGGLQYRSKVATACQTLDTAFINCNDCSNLQRKLLDTSESVSLMCQHLGVRTHSGRFLKSRDSEPGKLRHMSVQEIEKLTSELSRDLNAVLKKCNDQNNRLQEFADETDDLRKQINGLSDQVRSLSETLENDRNRAEQELTLLNEKCKISQEESDLKIGELNSKIDSSKNVESELRGEIAAVTEERENFYAEIEVLKTENDELEKKRAELKNEMNSIKEEICQKDEEIKTRASEISNMKSRIAEANQMLKQEKVKTKQNSNREDELQSKQENLINRLEELDEECENLKQLLSETEINRDDVSQQLTVAQKEVANLRNKIKDQNETIDNLEKENAIMTEQLKSYEGELQNVNTEIQSLKEKQDMLILFPDLTEMPSQPPSTAPPDLDPFDPRYLKHEMQQQIFANTLRISKLDELNHSLRNSLSKMEAIIPEAESNSLKRGGSDVKSSVKKNQSITFLEVNDPVSLISESQINHYKTELVGITRNGRNSSLGSRQIEALDGDSGSKNIQSASPTSMENVTRPLSSRNKKASHRQGIAGKPPLSARAFSCVNCSRSFKSSHELHMHSNFCC